LLICQAQRAATGIVVAADMTTETQVLFLICANLRNLRIGYVTSVTTVNVRINRRDTRRLKSCIERQLEVVQ
jgi:hypothetical protein